MNGLQRYFTAGRSRWNLPLGLLLVLAITVGWWQPWQARPRADPRPVALVPTPTPAAPTPTLPPQRIALPPAMPPVSPSRSATSVSRVTASATPGLTDATGLLLYIGRDAGEEGIVAINADGTNRRLLVAGHYEALAWSPDGGRFAAVGPLAVGFTSQVAIFTPEGRALARYPFEGVVENRLLWSPDGSKLAGNVRSSTAQPATNEAWQIAPQGGVRRVTVPDARLVFPFAWTSFGTLIVASYEGGGRRSLWLASDDGSTVVREFSGAYTPLGLSHDGETLYTLSNAASSDVSQLVAVNLRTDQPRVIVDADRLGALALGELTVPGQYRFVSATVAPDESHLAVVIQRAGQAGTPSPVPALPESVLIFLWPDGSITGVLRFAPGVGPGFLTWSPDGELLAAYGTATTGAGATTRNLFIVVDWRGAQRASAPFYLAALYGGMNISWSPDSRWLVYSSLAGVSLVRAETGQTAELASPGGYPVWQPRKRP